MDYAKKIAGLKEKINGNMTNDDNTKIEQCYQGTRNELLFKREQLSLLKKKLENAHSEMFELNREVERTQSLVKETRFNFNLLSQKSTSLEDTIKKLSTAHANLKISEEMRLSEVQALKESCQKITLEKDQLSRKLEELKDKLKISLTSQNELEVRQAAINNSTTEINACVENLVKGHTKVMEFKQELQCSEELQNSCKRLKEENEKVRKQCNNMENVLTQNSGKCKALQKCMVTKSIPTVGQNLVENIKFLQWKNRCQYLEEKNKQNEETMLNVIESIKRKVEINTSLLQENEEYKIRIQEMQEECTGNK